MRRFLAALAILAPALFLLRPANADVILFHGKVTMADGTPPVKSAGIEYACPGRPRQVVAITGKTGAYLWKYQGTAFDSAMSANDVTAAAGAAAAFMSDPSAMAFVGGQSYGTGCVLRAAISGFVSSTIDLSDHQLAKNPQLPDLVLKRPSANEGLEIEGGPTVPRAAQKAWDRGMKALQTRNWDQAETQLQAAVTASPKFALGWSALALACHNQRKPKEARDALERAVELDPKTLSTRFRLMRAEMDVKD